MIRFVYLGLFVISCGYAWLLNYWQKSDPVSFNDMTWLQVVIGTGYVLAASLILVSFDAWLLIFCAFAVASLPIVFRSVMHVVSRNKQLSLFNGGQRGGGRDE